ncbi:MAG TPA: YciI family protein [Solirubrobacteraceae bacterium]|nr:YciI family protein [Solirubrobacteraceae bacterium]
MTDGPFAETREQLGGFIELDVDTFDEAVEWAQRCPVVAHGAAEVRPVAAM